MQKGKVMLGMLAGAAAGALAGILLAPDKGSATRESIRRKGSDALDEAKNKFNSIVENVSSRFGATDHSAPGELRQSRSVRQHSSQPRQSGNQI